MKSPTFRERKAQEAIRAIADKYWLAHLKRWPLKRVYGKPTGAVKRIKVSKHIV